MNKNKRCHAFVIVSALLLLSSTGQAQQKEPEAAARQARIDAAEESAKMGEIRRDEEAKSELDGVDAPGLAA